MDDISKVYTLFMDIERSKAFLKEYEKEFMFSEIDEVNKTNSDKMEIEP